MAQPVEFYATGAPHWWRFHVLTLGQPPSSQLRGKTVLHENGAFRMWASGVSVDPQLWIARLQQSVVRASAVADEVRVVLPDRIGDFEATLRLHRLAYPRLCGESVKKRGVRCVAVVQFRRGENMDVLRQRTELLLSEMPDVDIVAVPTKATLGERRGGRIVVNPTLVVSAVARVADAVAGKKPVHALAPQLRAEVLRRIAPLIASFDTTSWTRPVNSLAKKLGIVASVKDAGQRELAFALAVAHLVANGVPIADADVALQRLPERVLRRLGVVA